MRSREHIVLGAAVLLVLIAIIVHLFLLMRAPQWLTAIATVALAIAAFLAIAKEQVQAWFIHPTLEVLPELYHHPTRIDLNYGVMIGKSPAYYVVFQVKNSGRIPARNVEVAINSVVRTDLGSEPTPHEMLTPFNLKWAYTNDPTMALIPIDSSRPMALGHITAPSTGGKVGESPINGLSLFWLELFVRPNSRDGALEPGSYDICIRVSADNAQPTEYTVHLRFTGKWHDDTERIWPLELEAGIDKKRLV
ncbi:hypothetical protein ACFL6M_04355 [Candidatus Eisenbacteria bacterium]|uniref:DUF1616 domain-containing protein n=1 Tax=Eiseniibacteriota bacterium TaxID=2212470 RepID=A0ABV6YKF8_UNCEI